MKTTVHHAAHESLGEIENENWHQPKWWSEVLTIWWKTKRWLVSQDYKERETVC